MQQLLVFFLAGCMDEAPAPSIASVTPKGGPAFTHIDIRGRFVAGRVRVDFTSDETEVETRLDARLGGRALDVVYRDLGWIEGIVPDLAPGPHDLEVRDAYGEALARSAFIVEVVDGGDPTDGATDDAEGDAGEDGSLDLDGGVDDRSLRDVDVLDVSVGEGSIAGDLDADIPDVVTGICGDGRLAAGETCDDGNFWSGDGCDALCQVEPGYSCGGEPSNCVTIDCGNSILEPPEMCDDGDTMNNDGCDDTCNEEPGWVCDGCSPTTCVSGPPVPIPC